MLINLKLRDQDFQFRSGSGERLLYAGLSSRIDLPYECASGTCGTCKAKLVSGEVVNLWGDAPGQTYLGSSGEILLCQSAARGICQIEVQARAQTPTPSAVPVSGTGVIQDVRPLAPDVLAFSLEIGRTIDFEAGQFFCLQFPQATGFRSYSIVNFERECSRLDFVVKRKADGRLTPWLFQNDIEGSLVEWFGPLGRAIFQQDSVRDILCIAGGTGIAGIMSILRCAMESGHFAHSKGNVFFGVRSLADAFYLMELQELVRGGNGKLNVTITLSEEDPMQEARSEYPLLQFQRGFVHEVAKKMMAGQYQDIVAYLAGPKPAVDAAMRVLLAARVPVQNIRLDKFS